MTKQRQSLGAIKSQLQKIAQDIETPIESAVSPQGSPEEVIAGVHRKSLTTRSIAGIVAGERRTHRATPRRSPMGCGLRGSEGKERWRERPEQRPADSPEQMKLGSASTCASGRLYS